MAKSNKGPVDKLRDGNLTVDIWGNERTIKVNGKAVTRTMYSVVQKRHYREVDDKGKQGEWKESDNIPYQDAPRAAALLLEAYGKVVKIREKAAEEAKEKGSDDESDEDEE